jgi:hypothetical protein
MKDLGLPITYRDGSAPAAAPSTSTVQSLPSLAAVLSGASQVLSDTLRRPVSSTSMSSSTLRGSSPLKQELASSPIKSDFKVPSRSDTAFSDQGPDARIPYSNSYIPKPFSNSPLGPNAMPFSPRSRVESSNPPPSQSFYVSQIEREVCAQFTWIQDVSVKLTKSSFKTAECPSPFCRISIQGRTIQIIVELLRFISPKCSQNAMSTQNG